LTSSATIRTSQKPASPWTIRGRREPARSAMRAHAPRLGWRDCMAHSAWCIGCVSQASGPTRVRTGPTRARTGRGPRDTTKRPKEPPVPSVSRVADTSTNVPGRFGSRAPSSKTYDRGAPLPRLGTYPRVSRKMGRIWRCRPRSVHKPPVPRRAAERRTQQNARRNHQSRPSPESPMQAPASRVGSDPGPLRAIPTIPALPLPRLGTYPRVSRKMGRIWRCRPRSVHRARCVRASAEPITAAWSLAGAGSRWPDVYG
jgi:hypothetical protein